MRPARLRASTLPERRVSLSGVAVGLGIRSAAMCFKPSPRFRIDPTCPARAPTTASAASRRTQPVQPHGALSALYSAHSRLGRLRAKGAATPLPRPVKVGDRRSSVCASREGLRHGDRLVPRAAGSASWPGEGGPEREFATPPYRSTPPLATTGKKMAPCPSSG